MNLFPTRASAFGSGLVATVLVASTLTGCGAGQQAQTATQEPAVNGASAGIGSITLRDVRIRADQDGAELKPGRSVDLLFVAANESGTDSDRLVGITSDVGSVTIVPASIEIPAKRSLIVGKPEGPEAEELQALSNAVKGTATVKLTRPISNGLTYKFVLTFERAGQATIAVPVSAGESAERADQAEPPEEAH